MSLARKMLLVDENYMQMLKKFGGTGNADREPLEDTAQENSDKDIILTLPKTYRAKGEALLAFLKQNGISRDTGQQLLINGKAVPGTNFLDIMHDLLRYRDLPPPKGFSVLSPVLKSLNISREMVTNLQRYKDIMEADIMEADIVPFKADSPTLHSKSSSNHRDSRNMKPKGYRKVGAISKWKTPKTESPVHRAKTKSTGNVKKWVTW